MHIRRDSLALLAVSVAAVVAFGACAGKTPPVARPVSPPALPSATPEAPPPATPPAPVRETPVTPAPVVPDDAMAARSVDELNRESPLKPVFFEYDSADLTADAKSILEADATTLRKYGTWMVTIEGHCDERGTAEYNLALGERRAVAAQSYLVSLGIPAERLRTVSYGKEFPFDPGHDEAARAKNRRSHFVITGK
jgi:peptidoglycan-associated lipoprotein